MNPITGNSDGHGRHLNIMLQIQTIMNNVQTQRANLHKESHG